MGYYQLEDHEKAEKLLKAIHLVEGLSCLSERTLNTLRKELLVYFENTIPSKKDGIKRLGNLDYEPSGLCGVSSRRNHYGSFDYAGRPATILPPFTPKYWVEAQATKERQLAEYKKKKERKVEEKQPTVVDEMIKTMNRTYNDNARWLKNAALAHMKSPKGYRKVLDETKIRQALIRAKQIEASNLPYKDKQKLLSALYGKAVGVSRSQTYIHDYDDFSRYILSSLKTKLGIQSGYVNKATGEFTRYYYRMERADYVNGWFSVMPTVDVLTSVVEGKHTYVDGDASNVFLKEHENDIEAIIDAFKSHMLTFGDFMSVALKKSGFVIEDDAKVDSTA